MASDILLKDDDLWIRNGDFVTGEADLQNIYLIISLFKGSLKQYPLTGVGDKRLVNGQLDGRMRREIQLQLQANGYRLRRIQSRGSEIAIEV